MTGAASAPAAGAAGPRHGLRVAYMTGQYPRATDTFIQREVAALRAAGRLRADVLGPQARGEGERRARAAGRAGRDVLRPAGQGHRPCCGRTCKLLAAQPAALPVGLEDRADGPAAGAEGAGLAGGVFRRGRRRGRAGAGAGLSHLHNHFSNSSCSVAMLAAELGGFTFSFTMHGPAEFFEPKYWRIDEKIRRALFVAASAISAAARRWCSRRRSAGTSCTSSTAA